MSQIVNVVRFDSNSLTDVTGLTVLKTDPYKPPARRLNIYELARAHKSKGLSGWYNKRIITIKVGISRDTRANVEASLDDLMDKLHGVEKILQLPQAGTLREYYSTFSQAVVVTEAGAYLEIDLIFECSDNFGYDVQPVQALSISGATTASSSDSLSFGGSAPTQVPVITFTLSALTGGTSKNVIIGNGVTGQEITINRTWTAGDLIIIDCFNRTVKVNGTEVAFTGAFPEFATGNGLLTYEDTLTTRTRSGTVIYNKRYT